MLVTKLPKSSSPLLARAACPGPDITCQVPRSRQPGDFAQHLEPALHNPTGVLSNFFAFPSSPAAPSTRTGNTDFRRERSLYQSVIVDASELWCWRRLLRVPWTARRSNQSILKEISPKYSLEGLMLKLKLQCFGYLTQRTDSSEKTLMLGKIEGGKRRG